MACCSPDTATSEDLRRFQVHLAQQQIGVPTINAAIAPLRFFFNVTLFSSGHFEDLSASVAIHHPDAPRLPILLLDLAQKRPQRLAVGGVAGQAFVGQVRPPVRLGRKRPQGSGGMRRTWPG